ncbi:MAG: phage minor head protein [Hydrogenophaga sp.]|nr:phage minor head protein [Hydrogenophaga sp.]
MPVNVSTTPRPDPQADFGRAETPEVFAYLTRLRPKDAVAYMAQRERLAVTYDWRSMWEAEHARAFTVSRMTQLDVLEALRKGIADSVAGDLTRKDFVREARAVLQREGWWGLVQVQDPESGDALRTRFDSRRLGLIFDTNTRTASAAGQWERIQQAKGTFGFLRYVTQDDGRVRAAHMAWHNLVLPVDDPHWNIGYPPNGWRCRCQVIPMRRKDVDKLLQAQQDKPPEDPAQRIKTTRPALEWKDWLNSKTGQVQRVPVGIDPGWAYNVGQAGALTRQWKQTLQNKLASWSPEMAQAATDLGMVLADREGLNRFLQDAVAKRISKGTLALAPIELAVQTQLAQWAADAGVTKQRDRVFAVDVSHAVHTNNRHGPGAKQASDQFPVLPIDYEALATAMSCGDVVLSGLGEPPKTDAGVRVEFTATVVAGWLYEGVLEVRRHTVVPFTFWKKKSDRAALPDVQAPGPTP